MKKNEKESGCVSAGGGNVCDVPGRLRQQHCKYNGKCIGGGIGGCRG